ncbi:MAG TPA: DUF4255 domain-containing protein [Steroidobacteraceae bacterium]|nr:DUF4255 domain-containing protein [Steroidobacteraceae bacterium]
MSNHLAVATVTAALGRKAHASAAGALDADVDLQFGRPVAPTGDNAKPTLHVYLYQVTPNAALRNSDLPTRDSTGRLNGRPRAAIDLHYLLTFYGDSPTLVPERMLAAVVRDLHSRAVIDAELLRQLIASGNHAPELDDADLATAHERVKFTPTQMSLEELSRLWSIMVQSPYALSVAYHASVVELDALESGPTALPVLKRGEQDRGVETVLGQFPQLDSWWAGALAAAARIPRVASFPAAQLGDRLLLTGATLGGDEVQVRFKHPRLAAATNSVIPVADRGAGELRLTLPDDATALDEWASGIYSVTVIVEKGGVERISNVMPLVFAPRVTDIQPNPAVRVGGDVSLTVTCRPKVLKDQPAFLLLGGREIAAEPLAGASDSLVFEIPDAPEVNNELVRIRVDGVHSLPFKYDTATSGFAFDPSQRVTIT